MLSLQPPYRWTVFAQPIYTPSAAQPSGAGCVFRKPVAMSLFSWLSREKQTKAPAEAGAGPAEPNRGAAATPAGARKSDRMGRRELLYSVVRESMARAGVLSASYRFKVLSLDAAGRLFLVMVDLAGSERAGPELLSDIEAVITQRAKSRHDLVVSAVYWRRSDQVGASGNVRTPDGRQQARGAAAAKPSQPAELLSVPPSMPTDPAQQQPASAGGFDPIQEDEMAALRAALANGVGGAAEPTSTREPARPAKAAAPGPAATGFPDTVVRRDDDTRSRTLSATQSGDLG